MKRFYILGLATVTVFALNAGLNVMAHHGWANFDRSRKVEVSGTIVESKYENPHCFVKLKAEEGEWEIELSAVPLMQRHGITAEMIKTGTRVTIVGHPHKKKAREMKAIRLIFDGKTYDLM